MDKNITAILLLDSVSRKYIKTNITELGLMGVILVNNFNEITDDMLKSCNRVVVLESYMHNVNSYSDIRLFKAILNIDFTFMGLDDAILDTLTEYGNVFRADITMLDFEMIQAALYQDEALENHKDSAKTYIDNMTVAKNIVNNEDNFDEKITNLAKEFITVSTELQRSKENLKKSEESCNNLQNINSKLSTENSALTAGFSQMLENAVSLNKGLKEYERIMSQDIYSKINIASYPDKPMIIYLKEIEELIHQNQFIETLFEMLRLQGRQSVKVLRLYDGNSCRRVKSLPAYYYRVRNQFLVSDITTNDFIVKVGDYTDIMDVLLTNKTGLDILIIVDCKSFDDVIINSASMFLNLCRNRHNLEAYELSKDNTIVNGYEDSEYLTWDHYEELQNLMSREERFLYLASRPVMKQVFDLYRLLSIST